jgi:hypothetical protein
MFELPDIICFVYAQFNDHQGVSSVKIEKYIGGRKGPQTRSKGKKEHRRVESRVGKTNVG